MIKNLRVSEEFLGSLHPYNKGKNAVVYLYGNHLIKLYPGAGLLKSDKHLRKILEFSDANKEVLDKAGVIRPKKGVIIAGKEKDYIAGYVTDIVVGQDLEELFREGSPFTKEKARELESDLRERVKLLSSAGIELADFHDRNIMYDSKNDRYVMIDIDEWECDHRFDYSIQNSSQVNYAFSRIKI